MNKKFYIGLLVCCISLSGLLKAQSCGIPPTLTATWSCNTASLIWSSNSNALYYDYKVDSAGVTVAQGSVQTTTAMITNLSPSTLYMAMVRSVCGSGDTSNWAVFSLLTPACPCMPPAWISGLPVACDSLVFSWDSVANSGYEYAVTTTPNPPATAWTATTAQYAAAGGLSGGTVYYIQVRTNCGNGTFSAVQSIVLTTPPCNGTTGIAAVNTPLESVYPNPAEDHLQITLNTLLAGAVIELTDAAGHLLYTMELTNKSITINVETLPAGIYFLKYRDREQARTYRFYKR